MEGTIKNLFEGSFHKFIKCINVDYERMTTSDTFLDLQVPPGRSDADASVTAPVLSWCCSELPRTMPCGFAVLCTTARV